MDAIDCCILSTRRSSLQSFLKNIQFSSETFRSIHIPEAITTLKKHFNWMLQVKWLFLTRVLNLFQNSEKLLIALHRPLVESYENIRIVSWEACFKLFLIFYSNKSAKNSNIIIFHVIFGSDPETISKRIIRVGSVTSSPLFVHVNIDNIINKKNYMLYSSRLMPPVKFSSLSADCRCFSSILPCSMSFKILFRSWKIKNCFLFTISLTIHSNLIPWHN